MKNIIDTTSLKAKPVTTATVAHANAVRAALRVRSRRKPDTVPIRRSECSQPGRKVTDQVDVGFFSGNTVTSQHTGRHVRGHVGMAPVMNVIARSRRACVWTVGALVTAALASAGVAFAVIGSGGSTSAPACEVTIDAHRYTLDREQVSNALVITAAASELGMAHHAVTVAIAAGLQESGLHNVDHGDRDSIGIFQQRPSQGWGTPSELLQPGYAARAFLSRLAQIADWESLPVTVAAQRVQRSATPNAYASWEAEARTIAQATTGEVTGALHCTAP